VSDCDRLEGQAACPPALDFSVGRHPAAELSTAQDAHSRPSRPISGLLSASSARLPFRAQGASLLEADDVAARVQRECAEQGIPEKVEDPVIIARVVVLAWAGRAKALESSLGPKARAQSRSVQRGGSRHVR
jgi:hypothetical protein